MAFDNNMVAGITAQTTVYTPSGDTGTIIGMTIAPVGDADSVIDVKIDSVHVVKALTVAVGTTAVPIGNVQKVVVLNGQELSVTSDTTVDVIVSYLE